MLTLTRNWILAGLVGLLVACGGGGGGDSAPGVQSGPATARSADTAGTHSARHPQ